MSSESIIQEIKYLLASKFPKKKEKLSLDRHIAFFTLLVGIVSLFLVATLNLPSAESQKRLAEFEKQQSDLLRSAKDIKKIADKEKENIQLKLNVLDVEIASEKEVGAENTYSLSSIEGIIVFKIGLTMFTLIILTIGWEFQQQLSFSKEVEKVDKCAAALYFEILKDNIASKQDRLNTLAKIERVTFKELGVVTKQAERILEVVLTSARKQYHSALPGEIV